MEVRDVVVRDVVVRDVCGQESGKIKRARAKLEKNLKKKFDQVNQDDLKQKVIEIHDRISKYASKRTVLTEKSISLFDNNQNSAEISLEVAKIAEQIKNFNAIYCEALKENQGSLNKHEIILL